MKRSELLEDISLLIYVQENIDVKNKMKYSYLQRAEEVLSLIEEYMIPKDKIKLSHLKFEDNGWEDEDN